MTTTPIAATDLEKRLDGFTRIGLFAIATALVTKAKRALNVGHYNLPAEAGRGARPVDVDPREAGLEVG